MTARGGLIVFLLGMSIGVATAISIGAWRTWRIVRYLKRFQNHPGETVQLEWDAEAIIEQYDEEYRRQVKDTIRYPLGISITHIFLTGVAVFLFVRYAQHGVFDWLVLTIGVVWAFLLTIKKQYVQPLKMFYGLKPDRKH